MFFLTFLTGFTADACLAIVHHSLFRHLFLASDRFRRTFAGACVCLGALATNRQVFAVTDATVASHVDEAFDVDGNFTAQVAFDLVLIGVDFRTDGVQFVFRQVVQVYPAH